MKNDQHIAVGRSPIIDFSAIFYAIEEKTEIEILSFIYSNSIIHIHMIDYSANAADIISTNGTYFQIIIIYYLLQHTKLKEWQRMAKNGGCYGMQNVQNT